MQKNKLKFTKMHGAGNDYIYINCLNESPSNIEELAIKLSDRHFGIGADGIVLIMPSSQADFRMRMFNADGSEGKMCGNASRCIGKYVYERGLTTKSEIKLETLSGIKVLQLGLVNNIVQTVTVNMGEPILEAENIPTIYSNRKLINEEIKISGQTFKYTAVSMGNPHAVIFIDEITDDLVFKIGPQIERHETFPARTNVEFVKIIDRNNVIMRVWERGSGETLACGTGASAVCVAASLNNLTDRQISVTLLGGKLEINWAADNCVYKTGEATFVFDGEVEI